MKQLKCVIDVLSLVKVISIKVTHVICTYIKFHHCTWNYSQVVALMEQNCLLRHFTEILFTEKTHEYY